MAEKRSVSIGGNDYHVRPFKTYRAVLVGQIVASATQGVRKIVSEAARFRVEFRDENRLQVTRQMCLERASEYRSAAETAGKLRDKAPDDPADVEEGEERPKIKDELDAEVRLFTARAEAYDQQLADMGDRAYVEIPQDPEFEQVVLAVFPKAFEMHKQLAELLALLVMPDSDLLEGWRKDSVHDFLEDRGAGLLEESDPAEIMELAKVANDVIGDQLRPLIADGRSLWAKWTETETVDSTATEIPTEMISGTESTEPAPTSVGRSEGSETPSSSSSESPTEQPSLTPTA